MSLRVRKLANSVTQAVNENVEALLKVSTGYTIDDAGRQVAQYLVQPKILQPQAMSVADLDHMGFGNQQGRFLSVYADGMIPAIRRSLELGTTIVILKPYGESFPTEWHVKGIIESYNDWVKVLIQDTGKKSLHDAQYFGFAGTNMKPFDQGILA